MTSLDEARQLCREIGGDRVDLWSLPAEALKKARTSGRPLREAAHDLVSGWLACRAGEDPSIPARILALWREDVLRWCRWNARPGVDPEDVAHDVLVRALGLLRRFDRPSGFRPWMWSITWRVLREHERRPSRRRWVLGPVDEDRPCDAPSAEEALQGSERSAQVQAILQGLPLELRTVLWLAYVDQRTRPQIVEITGWPLGSVNRRLHRARARFKEAACRRGLDPLHAEQRVNA